MINLGLSRITALVAQLPTYQTWKAIHIAGTNGKGSVAAYLSSLFLRLSQPSDSSAELKVGRFCSPHLIDRWDCITINDTPVSESLFLSVEQQVKRYADKAATEFKKRKSHDGDESETVTEFELLTATAFEIFSQQKCQVAIIECGLGGRLDATNVLNPADVACSVITKIGMDHVGILGNTLEAIAREKAAIVKQGVHMVIDGTNPFDVIESMAIIANSSNVAPMLSRQPEVEDMWGITKDKVIGRMPPHQYNNLVLALTAFTKSQDSLPSLTFTDPSPTVLPTILTDMRTSYPARLQHLSVAPLIPNYTRPILLDGAHNPQSAGVLKSYIDSLAPGKTSGVTASSATSFITSRFFKSRDRDPFPRTWVLAMSRGKDVPRILHTILESHDNVVTCHFSHVDGMPWISPMSATTLAQEAKSIVEKGTVKQASDVIQALKIAVELSEKSRKATAEKNSAAAATTTTATSSSIGPDTASSSSPSSPSSSSSSSRRFSIRKSETRKKSHHQQEQHQSPPPSDKVGETDGSTASSGDIEIVVAGSLYLASDLLRALRDGPSAVTERFDVGVAM